MSKITCALNASQIKDLFKYTYKAMQDALEAGEAFNADLFMRGLFDKIETTKDAETAAKFLQQVPSLIYAAAGTNDLIDLDLDVKAVRSLISKFKNPDTGFNFVIDKFRPGLTPEQLKDQIDLVNKLENDIPETDDRAPEEDRVEQMRPYSTFTSTFVEFIKIDPNKKGVLFNESVDPAKSTIYNTLRAIRDRVFDESTPFNEVVYEGKKLYLKAVKLTSVPQELLDDTTKEEVIRSQSIAKKGAVEFEGQLVIQAQDRVALVISDEDGKFVFFDESGKISTKEAGGKIVYQFTRNVRQSDRKHSSKLRVTDIYGNNDLIMSPSDILDLEIRQSGLSREEYAELLAENGKTLDERFKEIDQQQQEEFKQLEAFNKRITQNNEEQLLPLLGVSLGIPPGLVINNPTFAQLQTLPFGKREAFKTIRPIKETIEGFEKGNYTMLIDGKKFQVDRANITEDIANKIAHVLTNPKLSNKEKYDFISLFLSNSIASKVRSYSFTYNREKDVLTFKLRNFTPFEAIKSKIQKNDFIPVELTPENTKFIADGLLKGYTLFNENKGSKMTYNQKALTNDEYFDYNTDTGKFDREPSSYINLIMSWGTTEIYITPESDVDFFNTYMHYSLDTEFNAEVKDVAEEATKQLTIAEKKAAVVDALQKGAKLVGKVSKDVNAAGYKTQTQWTFTDTKGSKIAFYNQEKNITEQDLSKEAKLVLMQPFPGSNGVFYASPVGVYIDNKFIGYVQEKGYSMGDAVVDAKAKAPTETLEDAINKPTSDAVSEITTPAVEDPVEKSDEEILSPPGVDTPEEDDDIPNFVWDRSAKLPNGVTQEQVDAAKEWWSNSPLSKFIEIEHLANIVNSNVFARFIAAGKTLATPGKLGKIQINKATKGNYVDVYHEAWHVFSQLFLTKNDKRALYKEVRNSNPKWKNLSFLQIEEMIAEDFRSYALEPKSKKDMPKRNTIFRIILNFLRKVFGKKQNVNNVSELRSVKELYSKLYFADQNNNILKNYEPLIKNVMWDMLNRGPESISDKNEEFLNSQDAKLVSSSIDSIFSGLIDKAATNGVSKAGTLSILSDQLKNEEGVTNKEQAYIYARKKLQKALTNFETEAQAIGTPKNIEEDARLDIVKDNIRILTAALDNWGDKNSGMIKYHIEKSTFDTVRQKAVTYEIDSEEDPANEDNSAPDDAGKTERSNYDKNPGTISLEQMASSETLYILKSLFKINKETGKTQKNRLGFDELADFPTIWNSVTRAIGGMKDPAQMYSNLKTAALTFPELQQLIDFKLPDPNKIKNAAEMSITTGFWQDFKKTRVKYIQLTMFEQADGSYVAEVTEASNDVSSTVYKFKNKFRAAPASRYVSKTPKNNSILNLNEIVQDFGPRGVFDKSKSFEFARAVGIALDDLSIIKETLDSKPELYSLEYIFKAVKRFNEIDQDTEATAEAKKYSKKFKEDPISVLYEPIPAGIVSEKEWDQKYLIDQLAKLQGKYGIDSANFSVLNAERNLVFEHIEDFSASMQIDAINRVTNLRDLWIDGKYQFMSYLNPNINSFTNRSKILNSIFNVKSKDNQYDRRPDRTLVLNAVSGTQLDDNATGSNTTSLDKYGKFIQEMHMMLKGGLQEFMRHASKSSSFGIKVAGGIVIGRGKGDDNHLYVDIDQFVTPGTAEAFAVDNIFIDYISAELERIIRFKSNIDEFKNYVGYNRPIKNTEGKTIGLAGEFFTAFDDVLSKDVKNQLLNNTSEMDIRDTNFLYDYLDKNPDLKQKIVNDITRYFNDQTQDNLDFLNQNSYIDSALAERLSVFNLSPEDLAKTLVKAYTYNSWIHNFEAANLLHGDMSQFNHSKDDAHKRIPGLTSGGNGFRTDIGAQDFVNNVLNYNKPNPVTGIVDNPVTFAGMLNKKYNVERYDNFKYDGTFNTAILEDVVVPSVYLGQIEKGLTQDYTERFKTASKESLLEQFTKKERKALEKSSVAELRKKLVDKRVAAELDPYKKMTEGDGQGYITIDAYRTLKTLENKWGREEEALYQKIIRGQAVKTEDIVNLFPVYKVQNYGNLANTGLPVLAMHKFALAPLIPSMIKGSDLESLHEQMLADNIQYATFASGSKVGSVTSNEQPDKIYADDKYTQFIKADPQGKNGIKFTKNTIYLEYLKNVTNVPNAFKNKTIFSTQLRKLILEGLYNRGGKVDEKFDTYINAYEDAVAEYSKVLRLEILNEIGYEYKDGKYQGKLDKFLNLVVKELDRRAVPQHLIEYIGVTPSGNVTNDLSFHLEADEIEKILVSLIQKRLVKQKVKGEALVQVASSMTKGLWGTSPQFTKATEDEIRKYLGTNTLPFYNYTKDGTSAMKVAVAMQGDFNNLFKAKDLNGNTIGVYDTETVTGKDGKPKTIQKIRFQESLDRLNEIVKDEEWLNKDNNRKLVTMTAVRIPVQGLNSMEFMEVHHFLAPEAGNIIIPPTEIVAKSGADFDVDKLTTFMPNIDTDGKFAESGLSVEDIERIIKEQVKDSDQAERIIKTQKAALENRLITATRDLLALPENYANLVRPNETYLLKEIADELEEKVVDYDKYTTSNDEGTRYDGKKKVISPTKIFEVGFNIHKQDVNMGGKKGLGVVALKNAIHPIFSSIGAKMPRTYLSSVWDEKTRRYVDGYTSYDMRLLMRHNSVDGRISLSDIYDADGVDRIADLLSHKMNGLVDVEKDSWIFNIQGNMEVIPVLSYLLMAGVPRQTAVYFASQPLVREYVERQRIMSGPYSKITGNTPSNNRRAKGQAALDTIINKISDDVLNEANKLKLIDTIKGNPANIFEVKFRADEDGNVRQPQQYSKEQLIKVLQNPVSNVSNLASVTEVNKDFNFLRVVDNNPVSTENYYYTAKAASNLDPGDLDLNTLTELVDNNDKLSPTAIKAFTHFLEIEKQIEGIEALQRIANPDTKTFKTIEEIIQREYDLELVSKSSKLDPELVKALKNDSILSEFFDNKLVKDLLEPLFILRNNPAVSDYITDVLNTRKDEIAAKFGYGEDAVRMFINQFKNSIVNYAYQNYMTNSLDEKGNIVDVPEMNNDLEVGKGTAPNGARVEGDKMIVDVKVLEDDFNNKKYEASSTAADNYTSRGLRAFAPADDLFQSKASFFKYVMEREYLRSTTPLSSLEKNKDYTNFLSIIKKSVKDEEKAKQLAYEVYLNQKSLYNTFNRRALMIVEDYSFTNYFFNVINEFPFLKEKYPVLTQLSEPKIASGEKVITLNNKGIVKGEIADNYYQNIKDLADPDVIKVQNKEDNQRISELFQMLPLVSIYTNGIGYSKYGINKILPYDKFMEKIFKASRIFTENNLNTKTFDVIFSKIVGKSRSRFIDYVTPSVAQAEVPEVPPVKVTVTSTGLLFGDPGSEEGPGVKPTKPGQVVANIPQNKVSGVSSYGSTVTANDEAIEALGPNPHSIDMIEAGFRTRTTRSESEMAKYAIKVGDTIKHFGTSADGTTKTILATVTAIHPKGSEGWKGTWAKEGWREEDVNVIDRFKDGAAAIEFEVIKATTQPTVPSARKTYSGKVTSLQPNQIFVFGSNPLGINGNPAKGTGGAALVAYNIAGVKQGEKMDNKLSDSGKAWGITTVTAPGKKRSKTPQEITEGIKKLYEYAKQNPTKEFLVSDYSATNLNGYTGQEMADMFNAAGPIPSNIVFNENFDKLVGATQPTVEPVGEGQLSLFDIDPEEAISNFYSGLTDEQKQKLGTLDELFEEYRQTPYELSVDDFIDNIKRCKL